MPILNFLVIGAQKAGTTTFHRDLSRNPRISLAEKELGYLLDKGRSVSEIRNRYRQYFKKTSSDHIRGEVTTEYAKRPRSKGVAKRAHSVFGDDLKIIYLIRHPISRAVSHYWHVHAKSDGEYPPLDEAILKCSKFVDYSRYAYQIEPWLHEFGRDSVYFIQFERYVSKRREVIERVSRFIGARPHVTGIDPSKVYNPTKRKPVMSGWWALVVESDVYRKFVRPILDAEVRDWLRQVLFPTADTYGESLNSSTARQLTAELKPDVEKLSDIVGEEALLWDLSEW